MQNLISFENIIVPECIEMKLIALFSEFYNWWVFLLNSIDQMNGNYLLQLQKKNLIENKCD